MIREVAHPTVVVEFDDDGQGSLRCGIRPGVNRAPTRAAAVAAEDEAEYAGRAVRIYLFRGDLVVDPDFPTLGVGSNDIRRTQHDRHIGSAHADSNLLLDNADRESVIGLILHGRLVLRRGAADEQDQGGEQGR